ncbi:MAG TPA: SDR family oxidoreductase [Amycolatopsis sp.]|uniref:SDR family oxidoreductase n=1 Tax=Amycolatopsis sp. TaxID=37632 RepID=UPI002B45ED38|nr:SDR family oxidoreductase [Amycolatopsis sp.]HKS45599.1 SDR family oxidoreductase [Amycolatopsis sp.]
MTLIVTGGGRGIGAAICVLAADRGYDIVINYATDASAADKVADQVRQRGRQAIAVQGDVSSEDDVRTLFDTAAELGPLRGLVNNAGISGNTPGRLDEQDVETVRRVLDVNVTGVFLCCREAVRRMSIRYGGPGGAIVNVSSTAAHRGSPGEWVHYAASKAAVETLTFGLAQEVAREGIRVNAVSPGLVDTEFHAAAGLPERVKRTADAIPLGRAGRPEEIAEAVLWMLSPAASFTIGSTMQVSGGR